MHFLGLQGMPRRYRDYPDIFYYWNMVASLGRFIRIVSILIFYIVIMFSIFFKSLVLSNQRVSSSLEWVWGVSISHHSYYQNSYLNI
jgi:heme/copper-type cytochrome/quinol oxidase subunit 1